MKGYLKLKNAAKYLDMSEKTFRKHVMPHVKCKRIGGSMYFSIKELDEFMNDTGMTDEEIKALALDLIRKT